MLTPEEINEYRKRYSITPIDILTPAKQGFLERTKQAASQGISKVKAGIEQAGSAKNPLQLFESSLKLGAGAIETAFSPATGALEPAIKPTIGKGIEYAAEKISDILAVQKFATSKAGEITSRVAEDVSNLTTIAGTIAGSKKLVQGIPKVIEKGREAATLAGGLSKKAGEKSYGITITPEESTRIAMQSYQAKQGSLFNRVKNMIRGEDVEGRPITEANTAARKGLTGTEWRLGVQAKQIADDLWTGTIAPKLEAVKGQVNMKKFFGEVEKEIRKTVNLGRKNDLLEGLTALKEDFKNVGNIKLPKLQGYKEGWAEFIPQATYKGKPIASSLKAVKDIAAEKARQVIYKHGGEEIKQAYIDYGNLKSIMKAGVKSIADPAKRSLSRNVWEFIMDKTITPIATFGGKVLYRTGEGLEFIGKKGAKKVKDAID